MHVDEDLADAPVLVLAGAQVHLVSADHGLLGVALAAVGQALAFAHPLDALDHPLDDLLRDGRGPGRERRGEHRLDRLVGLVLVVLDQLAVQRLRELGAVAVERVGLQREAPGEHVGLLAILDRGIVGHVDRLRDGARDERLRRRHHADVALDGEVALAGAPAGVGAVEDSVMLVLQVRRAFDRHRAADVDVGRLDLGSAEAEPGEQVEGGIVHPRRRHLQRLGEEVGAHRPLVEDELDVEGAGQRLLDLRQLRVGETPRAKRRMIDAGRLAQ